MQNSSAQKLKYSSLRRAKTDEEYSLYQAALEWSLDDPIVIDGPEDLKSEQKWRGLVKPFEHQTTNLITFCRRLPVTLLADDVGLGKTISAGLIASELMARRRLSNILVVCPKILGPQWKEELKSKFDISAEVVTGRELVKAKPDGERGAIITTYNSARLYLSQIPEDRYQMLILDEAHKLRNLYGVSSAPMVAKVFQKVLADRFFKYVLMLTATPIQNRLWDLYSLVDLLTVARGHENPFGTPGMFARNYIADKQTDARQLRTEMRDQFRSIIYSYMSRIRRGDANLSFPERSVLLHRVPPTADELRLIEIIKGPIQELGILAQISILQGLTSSPHALSAQLQNMARNQTVPQSLANDVRNLVQSMGASAKLSGLAALVKQLRTDRPKDWRLVVFTGRRETQTTIEDYLLSQGIKVGTINGTSGGRNQDTISKFKASPPELHVIVSTEAGSEGVNLQAANILINFDLPWNPMIVEQRIGRIQRLGSEHANVAIYNIILSGTFEEYIVGRLMAKLQMASHAIGDIEALLEAADIGDEDEGVGGFEEQIRKLVLDSLAGKDVRRATELADKSIENAKKTLEQEEKNINSLLGAMGDAGVTSPKAPHLPPIERSMDAATFAIQGLQSLGGQLQKRPDGTYLCGIERRHEVILVGDLTPPDNVQYTDYRTGSPAFDRLAGRLSASSLQRIVDLDTEPNVTSHKLSREWVKSFGGAAKSTDTEGTSIHFDGTALVRVRATVAHDAYERLMSLACNPNDHKHYLLGSNSEDIKTTIENPTNIGIDSKQLLMAAKRDPSIEEFCRFYSERMVDEVTAAGDDERKRKRLEDEFTPRLEPTLVGLKGSVYRVVTVQVTYTLESTTTYNSEVQILPSTGEIVGMPEIEKCEITGSMVPVDCLEQCEVTGTTAIKERLIKSDFSGRLALPDQTTLCAFSGKRVLLDEVDTSDVTGHQILKSLLKKSKVSGKKAEPQYFGKCEFTTADAFTTELVKSEVSGKLHRLDEQQASDISGVLGHKSEFVKCPVSKKSLLESEGERCAVTKSLVAPGVLELCSVSEQMVIPTELETCSVAEIKGLKKYFVRSSVSDSRMISDYALRALSGAYCTPREGLICLWSGERWHPEDIRTCSLTGISIHVDFATGNPPILSPLLEQLQGHLRSTEQPTTWHIIEPLLSSAIGHSRTQIQSSELSPSGHHLAVCAEIKTMLGMRKHYAGFIYSITKRSIVGKITQGKRAQESWLPFAK